MNETPLFAVPAEIVIAGVGCTWCCVPLGQPCRGNDITAKHPAHAQRWYEYHNATHEPRDHYRIFTSYKKQANRIPRA